MKRRDFHNLPPARPIPESFYLVAFLILVVNWICDFLFLASMFGGPKWLQQIGPFIGVCAYLTAFPLSLLAWFPPLLVVLAIPNSIGWAYVLTMRKKHTGRAR